MKYEVDVRISSFETMTIEADTPEDVRNKLERIPDYGIELEVKVIEVRRYSDGEPA